MNARSSDHPRFSRAQIAERIANDIPEGWYVNLGIGIPTLVANHVPEGREVVFHAENGVVGYGSAPAANEVDRWLINAGKEYVTLRPGAAYMHHADSFCIVRGGHLDLCVLGAYQVAQNGDIANWATSESDFAPAVGGAMDLAAGASRVWVAMSHVTKDGEPRLVERCTYPLTATRAVSRVYTDLAVMDVVDGGFRLLDMVPNLSLVELRRRTAADIAV